MRLIDADELEEKAWRLKLDSRELIAKMIEDAPTIDAVPVVRCKDCKWWNKEEDANYGYCYAAKHCYFSPNWEISIYRTHKGDFFCADGKRRQDGRDDL